MARPEAVETETRIEQRAATARYRGYKTSAICTGRLARTGRARVLAPSSDGGQTALLPRLTSFPQHSVHNPPPLTIILFRIVLQELAIPFGI